MEKTIIKTYQITKKNIETDEQTSTIYKKKRVYLNNFLVQESTLDENNQFHSIDGKPSNTVRNDKGLGILQEFHKHGVLDNVDANGYLKNANYEYDAETKIQTSSYYVNGKLQSPPGDCPALTKTNTSTNRVVLREWYKDGILHREGGLPAHVEYNNNGNILRCDFNKGTEYNNITFNLSSDEKIKVAKFIEILRTE